jgi:predicted nucleotidyltransferase
MADESVVKTVLRYRESLVQSGIPVTNVVHFGSHVKDHNHRWSDIDVLVVSPRFDGKRKREDINLLWRIAARVDSRIEPVAVGQCQYDEDDSSAIIEIARREGEVISPPL